MLKIKEAIVVEGRYDKNALSQLVDALIVETRGFAVFKDQELLDYLRTLARRRGLILLTDSDGAGFLIRNHLKGAIPGEYLKQAYIPDVYGKERRKRAPGKEGKLGVEGMTPQVLEQALRTAGATFLEEETAPAAAGRQITRLDLYQDGFTGGANSAHRRKALLRALGLPERLSSSALEKTLNALVSWEEYQAIASTLK